MVYKTWMMLESPAVDRLYEAVVDPALWPVALDELARSMGATGCMFFPADPSAAPGIPVSLGIQDFMGTFIRDGWYLRDHRAQRGWPLLKAGAQVLLDHDIASDAERRLSPYYQELLRPFDLPWWAALALNVQGSLWCLPILRDTKSGPFMQEDRQQLMRLIPELRRVVSLAEKAACMRIGVALATLEQVGCAALIVGRSGKVVQMNVAAERIVEANFQIRNGNLYLGDPLLSAKFRDFSAGRGLAADTKQPDVMKLDSGSASLVVERFPLRGPLRDVFSDGEALLTISDLAEPKIPSATILAQLFRLAPSEGAMAALVARGDRLSDAANSLQITKETARSRLKAIFAKTSVNRQAELVALLARLRP